MFQTSHRERIDALELLGATFVDKKRDLLGALKFWKRAMDLRYIDSNNIVQKPEPKHLIMAYDYAKEVRLLWFSKVFLYFIINVNIKLDLTFIFFIYRGNVSFDSCTM